MEGEAFSVATAIYSCLPPEAEMAVPEKQRKGAPALQLRVVRQSVGPEEPLPDAASEPVWSEVGQ